MPRSFVERESPIIERRAPPPPAISSISSMLDHSSSPPSSKRRKVINSPPYIPISLTRQPARRAVSDAPANEGIRTPIGYSGYTPVYPPREIEQQRRPSNIPSASHPDLPPVSAITSSRGSSFESERPLALSLPSIFGQSSDTTAQSPSSRYPYETDYQQPTYRSPCDQPPSYPSPSPSTPQYTSSNPPLLTHPYPSPRGGAYMPRPSQSTAVSWHDRSPFSPSLHGSTDSYEQVARLGTKRRRGNLPKHVTDTLRSWLTNHVAHPYPTEEEKQQLCQITGLNMNQVCKPSTSFMHSTNMTYRFRTGLLMPAVENCHSSVLKPSSTCWYLLLQDQAPPLAIHVATPMTLLPCYLHLTLLRVHFPLRVDSAAIGQIHLSSLFSLSLGNLFRFFCSIFFYFFIFLFLIILLIFIHSPFAYFYVIELVCGLD